MKKLSKFGSIFFLLLFLILATQIWARGEPQTDHDIREPETSGTETELRVAIGVFFDSEDTRSFAEAAVLELELQARNRGYQPRTILTDEPAVLNQSDFHIARDIHERTLIELVVVAQIVEEDRRIVWRFGLFHGKDRLVLASDSAAAFGGLSALPRISESVQNVMQKLPAIQAEEIRTIAYRISLFDLHPRAQVFFGDEQGRVLGTADEQGNLVLPLLPLFVHEPVTLTSVKSGFHPSELTLVIPRENPGSIPFPKGLPQVTRTYNLGIRVPGIPGVNLGIQLPLLQDILIIDGQTSLGITSPFLPGSRPLTHLELGVNLLVYLYESPSRVIRGATGLGVSGILTLVPSREFEQPFVLDGMLTVPAFLLEFHTQSMIYYLGMVSSYSLGTGFITRGWTDTQYLPVTFSLGVKRPW